MKKIMLPVLVFFAVTMIFISCTKNNAVKPAKVTSAIPDNSFIIATDVAGTAIWSGTDNPPTTVGNVGDFYINTTFHNLYGPKTASGWGAATPLQGTPGSKILSGATNPPGSTGAVGDFYLNTTTLLLYGPKTASGWGTGISLKGTANVIYSGWITPPTYAKDTVFGTFHFDANIAASRITQGILDRGTVLVYGKLDGYNQAIWPTSQVSELPIIITYMNGSTPNQDTWSANVTLGNIQIDLVSSLNEYTSISNAHQFRYVIIPGGVATTAAVNYKDYKQVQQEFHIPD